MERPNLSRLLDDAVGLPVTLVDAPAGYGKTLLLEQWARSCAVPVDRVPPGADGSARVQFMARAVDDMVGHVGPQCSRVLVFDDVHEVTAPETVAELARLLRRLPAGLRVILAGRGRPSLGLGRLRAEGRLVRLGVDDLRFSAAEVRAMVARAGADLTDPEAAQLADLADGWPVVVGLAVTTGGATVPTTAEELAADPLVADYLDREVLSALAPSSVDMLEQISICDQVPARLAVVLTDDPEVADVLAAAERATGLVRWHGEPDRFYTVHGLLRTHLLDRLERRSADRVGELRVAASRWFEAEGRLTPALHQARHSGDHAWLAEFVRRRGVELIGVDPGPVDEALRTLGAEVVAEDPDLAALGALCATQGGAPLGARFFLDHPPTVEGPGERAVARVVAEAQYAVAFEFLPADRGAAAAEHAARANRPADVAWLRTSLGWLHLRTGDPGAARADLALTADVAKRLGLEFLEMQAQVGLGVADGLAGRHERMAERASATVALAAARRWTSPWLARAHGLLAIRQLNLLHPTEALRSVEGGRAAAGPDLGTPMALLLSSVEAAARADLGEVHHGMAVMRDVRAAAAGIVLPPLVRAYITLQAQRVAARAGANGVFTELAGWRADLPDTAELALLEARVHVAAGRPEIARRVLQPVVHDDLLVLLPATSVEAELLSASAAEMLGEPAAARQALGDALQRAEASTMIRPFALTSPSVRALLAEQAGGFGAVDEFAGHVLNTIGPLSRTPSPHSVLTEREQTVLARLAGHRSLDEIADDLGISPNTLKTHLRSIYAKVGASKRRDVVVAARASGLL